MKQIEKEEQKIITILRNEKEKQGKSYNGLGDELHMSPNSVKRTLLGLNSPTLTNLLKVAWGLGLKIEIRKR